MIAKDNEEKRNQLWKIVISVTSIVIIIVAAFFAIKLFTANPLEGKWESEDNGMILTIKDHGDVTVDWSTDTDGETITAEMKYDQDRDMKIFTLRKDSKTTTAVDEYESQLSEVEGTYEYSIEQSQLILTDREYGDQRTFDKK